MLDEFKDGLVNAVKAATEVLDDDDALAIVQICRRAADREIANVTERYLEESIKGGETDA